MISNFNNVTFPIREVAWIDQHNRRYVPWTMERMLQTDHELEHGYVVFDVKRVRPRDGIPHVDEDITLRPAMEAAISTETALRNAAVNSIRADSTLTPTERNAVIARRMQMLRVGLVPRKPIATVELVVTEAYFTPDAKELGDLAIGPNSDRPVTKTFSSKNVGVVVARVAEAQRSWATAAVLMTPEQVAMHPRILNFDWGAATEEVVEVEAGGGERRVRARS